MANPALMDNLLRLLVLALGLSVGSFLNVVIHRLPRPGLNLARPRRSFCPVCGAPIRWFDNLPVLSWLRLRARCRDCRKPIPIRYPLVELASGLLALHLFNLYGLSPAGLIKFYILLCLLAIALIDLELMIIPVELMYPATGLSLLSAWAYPDPALAGPWLWLWLEPEFGPRPASLAGGAMGLALGWGALKAVAAAYRKARGHEGLGDGDPPLLGLLGAFLGWQALPLVVLWSSVIGLVSVAGLITFSRRAKPAGGWGLHPLPFGPFLVLAALLYLFFGQTFLRWYWSLGG
ncbi:MAG: prepilin peptidase [Candidatus Adiutrix sp.]|jgi:leader peptidase (prepilin peptidase)/N-methyltransferase|nr:prepilin peptidase [Candidatus Adiutrix sp.]